MTRVSIKWSSRSLVNSPTDFMISSVTHKPERLSFGPFIRLSARSPIPVTRVSDRLSSRSSVNCVTVSITSSVTRGPDRLTRTTGWPGCVSLTWTEPMVRSSAMSCWRSGRCCCTGSSGIGSHPMANKTNVVIHRIDCAANTEIPAAGRIGSVHDQARIIVEESIREKRELSLITPH